MIRFGLLGCGRIVARGMIPGLLGSDQAELTALASERPGVAQEMAVRHGAKKACDSYQAVLDDPEIDAVYVPTSGDLHHKWTIAAAEAGKHVLCEKPLATTVTEAEEMAAACKQHGVILQEAAMWRHHTRPKQVLRLLKENAIGPLRTIIASFSFDIDRSDWRLHPERGGGAMWDIGCYGVNAARLFTGSEPTDIYANAHWASTGVDMSMQIALKFPGDVLANIDCSFESPFRCHLELVGEQGRMVLDHAFLPGADPVITLQKGTGADGAPAPVVEMVHVPDVNQYVAQVDDFCASIRAGKLLAPAEDGVANMKVLEAILNDARSRR